MAVLLIFHFVLVPYCQVESVECDAPPPHRPLDFVGVTRVGGMISVEGS